MRRRLRRDHLILAAATIAIVMIVAVIWATQAKMRLNAVRSYERSTPEVPWHPMINVVTEQVSVYPGSYLTFIARNLMPGGPAKDEIPSIDRPSYVLAGKADLEPADTIIGIDVQGVPMAYPLRIMRWHEVVNDEEFSVTYCPLTDSAIVYRGKEFGVSGLVYNSNLVMYDRKTGSLYPQMLGIAADGPDKGLRLERVHSTVTSWGLWKAQHPNSLVLSDATGHDYNYSEDPYAGYVSSPRLWFPAAATDETLPSKATVIGIERKGALAVLKTSAISAGEQEYDLGGESLHISYDPYYDTIKVTGIDGPVDTVEAYWFAWYAYHPDTEVLR